MPKQTTFILVNKEKHSFLVKLFRKQPKEKNLLTNEKATPQSCLPLSRGNDGKYHGMLIYDPLS